MENKSLTKQWQESTSPIADQIAHWHGKVGFDERNKLEMMARNKGIPFDDKYDESFGRCELGYANER